jgi:hypothetical protein
MLIGLLKLRASKNRSLLRGETAITTFLKTHHIVFSGPKCEKGQKHWQIESRESINKVLGKFTSHPLDPSREGILSIKISVVSEACQEWIDLPLVDMQAEMVKDSQIPRCAPPKIYDHAGDGIYFSPKGRGWYLRRELHAGTTPKLIYPVK